MRAGGWDCCRKLRAASTDYAELQHVERRPPSQAALAVRRRTAAAIAGASASHRGHSAARCTPLATLAAHSPRKPCRLSGRRQDRSAAATSRPPQLRPGVPIAPVRAIPPGRAVVLRTKPRTRVSAAGLPSLSHGGPVRRAGLRFRRRQPTRRSNPTAADPRRLPDRSPLGSVRGRGARCGPRPPPGTSMPGRPSPRTPPPAAPAYAAATGRQGVRGALAALDALRRDGADRRRPPTRGRRTRAGGRTNGHAAGGRRDARTRAVLRRRITFAHAARKSIGMRPIGVDARFRRPQGPTRTPRRRRRDAARRRRRADRPPGRGDGGPHAPLRAHARRTRPPSPAPRQPETVPGPVPNRAGTNCLIWGARRRPPNR